MSPLAESLRGDVRLSHDLDDAYASLEDAGVDVPEWIVWPELSA